MGFGRKIPQRISFRERGIGELQLFRELFLRTYPDLSSVAVPIQHQKSHFLRKRVVRREEMIVPADKDKSRPFNPCKSLKKGGSRRIDIAVDLLQRGAVTPAQIPLGILTGEKELRMVSNPPAVDQPDMSIVKMLPKLPEALLILRNSPKTQASQHLFQIRDMFLQKIFHRSI
jgi:hypothetical protein